MLTRNWRKQWTNENNNDALTHSHGHTGTQTQTQTQMPNNNKFKLKVIWCVFVWKCFASLFYSITSSSSSYWIFIFFVVVAFFCFVHFISWDKMSRRICYCSIEVAGSGMEFGWKCRWVEIIGVRTTSHLQTVICAAMLRNLSSGKTEINEFSIECVFEPVGIWFLFLAFFFFKSNRLFLAHAYVPLSFSRLVKYRVFTWIVNVNRWPR